MNNKVFFLAISFFVVGNAYSQLTNTGILKVNSNTLLYTSDLTDMSNVGVPAVVTNDGNIRVGGNFTPGTDPTKFVNTYTNDTNYGQLIISEASTVAATQKITQQTVIQQEAVIGPFSQIGFPFKGYNVTELLASLGLPETPCVLGTWSPSTCFGLRKFYGQAAMYYFDNRFLTYEPVVEEMLTNNFDISNGKRIVLNNISNDFFATTTSNPAIRDITGTPENRVITPHSEIPFNPYSGPEFTGAFHLGFNKRGQAWEGLFEDPFRMTPNDDRFRHLYQFANPYPSNIDFSYIGITGTPSRDTDGMALDILGLAVIDTSTPVTLISDIYSFITHEALFETTPGPSKGRLNTGDVEALLVRPYQAFTIFGNSASVNTFNFNDGLKSFLGTPKALDADGNGVIGDNDLDGDILTGTSFGSSKKYRDTSYPDMSNISIGFQVYDDENDKNGSLPVYVYGNENISNNYIFNNKFDNNGISNNNVLYTLKTDYYGNRVDGVADFNYKYKAQSVKMNEYRKIPLGFKVPVNGDGKYIIKTGKNRQIRYGGDDSAFPTLFTFVDEKLGKSIPITTDFSYEFEEDSNTENRFYIVYKNKPVDESGNKPVVTNTKIGKEIGGIDNYLLIGTDVNVENPNIQVYSVSGQLLDTFSSNGEKKIKLKNYAPGVYFVKVDGLKIAIKLISFNY
jgi:hypothetical protein